MLHMDKKLSPPSKPPRVSVPLDAEVLEVFQRFAKAANMSTGRAIGEWLADTVEAAEVLTLSMERAKAAPKLVLREMHSYAQALADETTELIRTVQKKGRDDAKAATSSARKRSAGGAGSGLDSGPPSCNTGGKVPKTTHKRGS